MVLALARISVASVVRGIVLSKPFLRECLAEGIINYSALSRAISEDLRVRGVEASHAAVKMALIRVRSEIIEESKKLERKLKRVLGSTVLQLQSDLTVFTVKKHNIVPKLPEIIKSMEIARFFQVLQGINTFTFIVSREDIDRLTSNINKDDVIETLENQSAIVLVSPREIVETPGIVAFISSILYENDINITQVVSCYNDTIILVESTKAWEAFRVLETLIKSMRT